MAVNNNYSLSSDIMIELHVSNFDEVKKFYEGLGFKIVWERKPKDEANGYMVMRMGKSILNFYGGTTKVKDHDYFRNFPKDSKRGYAVEIIIPIKGIEKYYAKINKQYKEYIFTPLQKKYSHVDFRMEDINGFYLRFVERYNWVDGRDENGNALKI